MGSKVNHSNNWNVHNKTNNDHNKSLNSCTKPHAPKDSEKGVPRGDKHGLQIINNISHSPKIDEPQTTQAGASQQDPEKGILEFIQHITPTSTPKNKDVDRPKRKL